MQTLNILTLPVIQPLTPPFRALEMIASTCWLNSKLDSHNPAQVILNEPEDGSELNPTPAGQTG